MIHACRSFVETDGDSGVDESTQNGSPTKTPSGSSRIPKKTPPLTPTKSGSRGRSTDARPFGARPPIRSKSVPKPFTSYGLSVVSTEDIPPIKKGTTLFEISLKVNR